MTKYKFLITGNMGYVGPNLARHLRKKYPDSTIIGFDSGFFATCSTSVCCPESPLNAQIFGDIRQLPDAVLRDVDAVFHLAAISNDPMGNAFEKVTMEINHEASVQIAKKAKVAGVRAFVFASSCSVYGFAEDAPRNEDSPLNPLTAYARSKVATEYDIAPLAAPEFVVSSLRFATACGMSPRLRLDLVLNDFVASAIATKKINILSDGTPWRPLINTLDMARAMEWAAFRNPSDGGSNIVINVGSAAWNFQVKELASAVQNQLPDVDVSINTDAAPDKRSYKVDFSKFQNLAPMFQPQETLESTIKALAEGFFEIGFRDANFRNSNLVRLRMLNALGAAGHLDRDLYQR